MTHCCGCQYMIRPYSGSTSSITASQTQIQRGDPDMVSRYLPTDSPSCPIARAIERPVTSKSAMRMPICRKGRPLVITQFDPVLVFEQVDAVVHALHGERHVPQGLGRPWPAVLFVLVGGSAQIRHRAQAFFTVHDGIVTAPRDKWILHGVRGCEFDQSG